MTGAFSSRDGIDVDALVTDRYLEALLSAHARGADAAPAAVQPASELVRAADRLARDLPRLHPSFRFEEALASRLAEAASRMRLVAAVGSEGAIVPLPSRSTGPAAIRGPIDDAFDGDPAFDGDLVEDGPVDDDGRPRLGRPLLIGGALTSAALSLAGAAYLAWRLNHPPNSAMARAIRAVARQRLA